MTLRAFATWPRNPAGIFLCRECNSPLHMTGAFCPRCQQQETIFVIDVPDRWHVRLYCPPVHRGCGHEWTEEGDALAAFDTSGPCTNTPA